MTEILKSPFEQFIDQSPKNNFVELFQANIDDVDIKTEVSHNEVILINNIIFTNDFLISIGVGDVFESYIEQRLRLLISKDRASRKEFVDINKSERFNEHAQQFTNLKNILDTKQ